MLYPGTERHAYAPLAEADGVEGVGAIPLRPEEGGAEVLRALLGELLKMPGRAGDGEVMRGAQ